MSRDRETRGYFDSEAAGWSQRYRTSPHFRKRLETVMGWVAQKQDRLHLLDYGCGSGVMLRALLESGKQIEVTGVDASPGMIEAAKATLVPLGPIAGSALSRLEVIREACIDGAYARQTYDGVLCLGVLEYLAHPHALLKRLISLLEPGGFLILSCPNRNSLLRAAEQVVIRHPRPFRAFGAFGHLTGEEAYLQHQTHQFAVSDLDLFFQAHGCRRTECRFHVAPSGLSPVEHLERIGMTAILEYRPAV